MHSFVRYFFCWSPLNESNEELRMEHLCFPCFQDYAIKAEIDLHLLPLVFGRQKSKQRLTQLARDRQRRYRSRLVNLGDQVERWRELCTLLDVCDSKQAKHTPSIAFRHLPPNSARFSYTTERALFISAQLSSDAVSALRKIRVLI